MICKINFTAWIPTLFFPLLFTEPETTNQKKTMSKDNEDYDYLFKGTWNSF